MSQPEQSCQFFQSGLTTFQSHLGKLQEIEQTLPQGDARRVQLEEIRQSTAEIAVTIKFLTDRF
jgi:hypothetical protein